MKKKIAFKTLGCRLNQYESNAVVTDFVNAGYEIVDFNQQADAYVVNTCTVTNQSDHKSRQEISKATRKTDDAVVVVTGCMANNKKETLEENKNITYTIENDRKGSIFHLLDSHFKGESISPEQLEQDRFNFSPAEHSLLTRSMIKIQDGCNNFCTFCIVPHVRGRAESRSWESIEKNIKDVVSHGYKEIVLTGVNIGRYKYDGLNFEDLVEKILDIPGDFRVRISSIEPEGFGDKLFDLFSHPKLMPHLHLCLQSGSDRILLAMRRQYTIDEFTAMIDKIKSRYSDFNFTTDIITGFPAESEDDFQESIKLMEQIGFSHVHTFKYSVRNGTRAERMPNQIPDKVKSERSKIIRDLAKKYKRDYRSSLLGKTQRVLVEKIDGEGYATGYGEHYVPIRFKASQRTNKNNFQDVRLVMLENGEEPYIFAEVIKS